MLTEQEIHACKAAYREIIENELRDKMRDVMNKMSELYQNAYTNILNVNARESDDKLLHYYEIKLSTIAAMLEEAKKRG